MMCEAVNEIEMPCVKFLTDGRCKLAIPWEIAWKASKTAYKLVVASGFTFDGASIPRALWRLCGHPLEAPRVAAALAHDWLYAAHATTRAEADAAYRAICEAVGIGAIRRNADYYALRAFGWAAWRGHGEADQAEAKRLGILTTNKEQSNART